MHVLVGCLLWSQLIPTGVTQTYCTLKICCGDEDKNSKRLGEKVHLKNRFVFPLFTKTSYLQQSSLPM